MASAVSAINGSVNDPYNTVNNGAFTFAWSKYSCIREFYVIHIFFAYAIAISGFVCLVSRLIPAIKWIHGPSGRAYIISMLGGTASALLIHNTGLPLGVLYSFAIVLVGLAVGWIVIGFHQFYLNKAVIESLSSRIKEDGGVIHGDLGTLLKNELQAVLERRTFVQRFISLKSLHGIVMFCSWVNIVGRVLVTSLNFDSFTCHTVPYYKPIKADEFDGSGLSEPVPVPVHNPDYYKQPWAYKEPQWFAQLLLGPMAGAIAFGALYTFFSLRISARRQNEASTRTVVDNM